MSAHRNIGEHRLMREYIEMKSVKRDDLIKKFIDGIDELLECSKLTEDSSFPDHPTKIQCIAIFNGRLEIIQGFIKQNRGKIC